jgi:hypothetical protein
LPSWAWRDHAAWVVHIKVESQVISAIRAQALQHQRRWSWLWRAVQVISTLLRVDQGSTGGVLKYVAITRVELVKPNVIGFLIYVVQSVTILINERLNHFKFLMNVKLRESWWGHVTSVRVNT